MKIKILLFAEARDLAEADSVDIEIESETSKENIFESLKKSVTCLDSILETCNLAHNHHYVNEGTITVKETDELAVIPPIGGG